MGIHRRPSLRLSTRLGLAFATALTFGAGIAAALGLSADTAAADAAAADCETSCPQHAAAARSMRDTLDLAQGRLPAAPVAVAPRSPAEPVTSTTTTSRPRTNAPAATDDDDTASEGRESAVSKFCSSNPDRCTDGVPDKRSDRAEYQDDPRSNAEINSEASPGELALQACRGQTGQSTAQCRAQAARGEAS